MSRKASLSLLLLLEEVVQEGMHLARRLAGTGTAGAGCAQSQCLHHHTRLQTGNAASQPDMHPETPPSTPCALHQEHSSFSCTSHTCLSCQFLSTLVLMSGMGWLALTYLHVCMRLAWLRCNCLACNCVASTAAPSAARAAA